MENILNSYENILVYNIYKILIVSKPFHIRLKAMIIAVLLAKLEKVRP